MVDREQVVRLGQMVRLREAETLLAAEQSRLSRAELDTADQSRNRSLQSREDSRDLWLRLLGEMKPDPQLVTISGSWLLEQESQLEARELDLAIARSRYENAQADHAQTLAREASTRKIRAKSRKALEKYLEERQSLQLADSFLWRWRR